jgi:ferredoxin
VSIVEAIRADAAGLLQTGRARLILGYRNRHGRRVPILLADAAGADQLIYDAECRQNLAAYLRKPEVRQQFPVGVVAGPPVMRSLVMLSAESQISAEAVTVLAADENEYHGALDLAATVQLLRDRYANPAPDEELLRRVREVAAMSEEERAAFWTGQFSNCTRCHACRAACPGCYCQWCVSKRNVPQWISTADLSHGTFAWNVTRAFHHAGRCTLCGACEAACPQGLPLMLLNAWVAECVEKEFGHRTGYDLEEKPLIGSWRPEDDDGFVR